MSKQLNKKNIIIAIITILVLTSIAFFIFQKKEDKETKKEIFEIRIDENTLWKSSLEYSPGYTTTIHLEKDSFSRLISNKKNVYYYTTDSSVATVGFDGTINVHNTGECIIYGVTTKEVEGLSNYIKVVIK